MNSAENGAEYVGMNTELKKVMFGSQAKEIRQRQRDWQTEEEGVKEG